MRRDKRFGAGIVLVEISMKAACTSVIQRRTPRRMRCRVMFKKKFSTSSIADVAPARPLVWDA